MISSFEFDRLGVKQMIHKYPDMIDYVCKNRKVNGAKAKEILTKELTPDFYGYLDNKTLDIKKIKTLEIYRFFYRFSIEKLQQYVNSPTFLILIITYLKIK